MGIKSRAAKIWAWIRAAQIRRMTEQPFKTQQKVFHNLISRGAATAFGKEHRFSGIRTYADFQERVPVRTYEQAQEWFDRIASGEESVSWPGKPLYLAKTSGTTAGAKFIPVSREAIKKMITGARDALLMYIYHTGKADFLDGKMLFLSGSPALDSHPGGIPVGRLSGIVNHFVPGYLQQNRVPSYTTNCMEDWETKVRKIVDETRNEDLRLVSGIPPWVQMFFEALEDETGRNPLDVWPNLSLFVQGGVDFSPYKPIFEPYFEGKVDMVEVFPASEGFFALQDRLDDTGLLLMTDYGVFYEFIPLEDYGKPEAKRLTLESVELGKQYALIISTNAGLWAYDIGDTVKFTSINPYRIRVSGRVKHFISAFGEHVISEEVNQAILQAAKRTGAEFKEFTVAPLIREKKGESCHQWLIEFVKKPEDTSEFEQILDAEMQSHNPYYKDLRQGNILRRAEVKFLKIDASREYMRALGKLGGQNKFPRLSNSREIADALNPFILDETET